MRTTARCPKCSLNQFVTKSELCRKCGTSLAVKPPPKPKSEVVRKPRREIPLEEALVFVIVGIRRARRISTIKLARRMGCFRSYVSKVENYYCSPNLEQVVRIAEALRVTPAQLIAEAEKYRRGS